MASVTIGGTDYTIPELNFIALERAWPYIEQSMVSVDPIRSASTGIQVIAAGLMESPEFDRRDFGIFDEELLVPQPLSDEKVHELVTLFLKKQLKASELRNISLCINDIVREGGLEPEEDEDKSGEDLAASPSTVTAPDTSSSSSPQELKEEAGKQ